MPKKTKHGWECNICGELHRLEPWALSCEQGHEMILVKFKQDDLFKLIQFIYTKDDDLLTESLVKTLMKYRKGITK
jgi:hypothetical protein